MSIFSLNVLFKMQINNEIVAASFVDDVFCVDAAAGGAPLAQLGGGRVQLKGVEGLRKTLKQGPENKRKKT